MPVPVLLLSSLLSASVVLVPMPGSSAFLSASTVFVPVFGLFAPLPTFAKSIVVRSSGLYLCLGCSLFGLRLLCL